MWTKEALLRVAQTKRFAIVASSLVASASGAVGGYFFAKKRLEKDYAESLDREIQEAKAFYSRLNKTDEDSDLDKIAAKYENESGDEDLDDAEIREAAAIMEAEGYSQTHVAYDRVGKVESVAVTEQEIQVKASIKKNIFDSKVDGNGDFDQAEEYAKRERGEPYIITKDEFFENDLEFSQSTLEYYEVDDTLCDEQNHALNADEEMNTVGSGNLLFGRGSGDRLIVYIRNERLQAEYEVKLCNGSFAEEVLGFIEHSDKRIRKFRVDD